MRIVFVVESMAIGGSEVQACDVGLRLAERGHSLSFVSFIAEGPLAAGVSRIPRKVFPLRSLTSFRGCAQFVRFASYLKRERVEVVHAHDLYSNLFAVPAARLAGVPIVVSSRRDLSNWTWYTPTKRKILRHVQERGTHIVANAQAIKKDLVETDGFSPDKIMVIQNSVDATRFRIGSTSRDEIIAGASQCEKWVVLVGNMNPVYPDGRESFKGHLDLVEASKIVCAQQPNVRFVLVGDGSVRGVIEAAVQKAGLSNRFSFLGRRRDIPSILSCCDLGILASHGEGLPNALLEYMAAGLPIVATSVGGIPEVVENERQALLVPPRKPGALAAAILRVVSDDDLAGKLACAAGKRVKDFSFDRQLAALEQLYRFPFAEVAGPCQ
jgi:L-malate glycosyltransferase